MSSCLGDLVAALVDGELHHAARERAQRHLAHCENCRTEVDGHRRLKARLSGLATELPATDDLLTTRLLAVGVQQGPRLAGPAAAGPAGTGPGRPGDGRCANRPAGRLRPPGRRVRRRAAAGTALVALGLSAAFALGGPQPQRPSTPLDPGADTFVTEFVNTTADFPRARQAGLTNGGAGPTGGGAGSGR